MVFPAISCVILHLCERKPAYVGIESIWIVYWLSSGRKRRVRTSVDRCRLQWVVDKPSYTRTIRATPGTVSEAGGFPFSVDMDTVGPMANCTEDLNNLLNAVADTSKPDLPKNGYRKSARHHWNEISIATLDPHHWHLPSEVQTPQPAQIVRWIRFSRELRY